MQASARRCLSGRGSLISTATRCGCVPAQPTLSPPDPSPEPLCKLDGIFPTWCGSTCARLASTIVRTRTSIFFPQFRAHGPQDSNVATVSAAAQFLPMHPFRLFKVTSHTPPLPHAPSRSPPLGHLLTLVSPPAPSPQVILIDAPTLFSGTWSLAQGMLSDMTKEKVQFTPLSGVKELMAPWAGDEVADWILVRALAPPPAAAAF